MAGFGEYSGYNRRSHGYHPANNQFMYSQFDNLNQPPSNFPPQPALVLEENPEDGECIYYYLYNISQVLYLS